MTVLTRIIARASAQAVVSSASPETGHSFNVGVLTVFPLIESQNKALEFLMDKMKCQRWYDNGKCVCQYCKVIEILEEALNEK